MKARFKRHSKNNNFVVLLKSFAKVVKYEVHNYNFLCIAVCPLVTRRPYLCDIMVFISIAINSCKLCSAMVEQTCFVVHILLWKHCNNYDNQDVATAIYFIIYTVVSGIGPKGSTEKDNLIKDVFLHPKGMLVKKWENF